MKNGLIHYMDAYNFHDYGAVSLFEKRIQPAKELLKREGVPNMAVLITENGWWNGEGPARCVSHIPNRNAHAWDQELIQTEYLVKSQLLWQRHGATTDYSFVLPFYVERKGTKDWGLTRSNASAKRRSRHFPLSVPSSELPVCLERMRPTAVATECSLKIRIRHKLLFCGKSQSLTR